MLDYRTVHHILGEGNIVLSQSEGKWNGKTQAFYDLFRIENGKISTGTLHKKCLQ